MTPVFSTKFTVSSLKARITDLFNYSSILRDGIYANITAKIGNSIFHQNNNYNSTADIVIGTNTFIDFDLPSSAEKVLRGSYELTENVKIVNEVLYNPSNSGYVDVEAPDNNNFTFIRTSDLVAGFEAAVIALLATLQDVRVGFYNNSNNLLASTAITGHTDDTLSFDAVTLASYATITKIRILGTNIYTTTHAYSYSGCPEIIPRLQDIPDCYRSQMNITDCTVYPAGSTLSRSLTARYPLKNGVAVLPPETTSQPVLTLGPNIWTGGYTIDLVSIINVQQDDTLYIEQIIEDSKYPNVVCDAALCALTSCIGKFRSKLLEALRNGSRDLQALLTDNIVIGSYLDGIELATGCQDKEQATRLITGLSQYMGEGALSDACSCGCSDASSQGPPTEIFPLYTVPASDGRLVPYNPSRAFLAMQQVLYNGQSFLVTSDTEPGQNPDNNRGKFKYLGGGISPTNPGANNTGALTATFNKTSGIIIFTALTPIPVFDHGQVVITNNTITAGTDVEVYITNTTGGGAIIENKQVATGSITIDIINTVGVNLTGFTVWLNNKA